MQLFNAGYCGVFELFVRSSVLVQRSINLSSAENDAFDVLWSIDGLVLMRRICNDPLEMRVPGKFFEVGTCERMTEQGFTEKQDESFSKLA